MDSKEVVLITGTSKGIGKYLVEYYTGKGFQVIGCSRSAVDYNFDNYQHFCLDVADEPEVKKMFAEILKRYKKIDVLINNAGIASMNHFILTPMKTVENIFRTNDIYQVIRYARIFFVDEDI